MTAVIRKTNAARLLDNAGIGYSLFSTEVDPNDLSALTLAAKMGVNAEQMYKTLVLRGEGCNPAGAPSAISCAPALQAMSVGPSPGGILIFMTCIPGPAELDLKKAAKAAGCKSSAMVPLKEVLPLTGYMRGGCSPLGAKKNYPVFLDESAVLHDNIYVSAGLRGVQLFLNPDELLRAVSGQYADLCRD